jgi:hypothetical protein
MPNRYIKDFTGTTNPSLSGFTIYDDGQQTYKTSLDTLRTILVDSGSHTFIGDQDIHGNLTVTGSTTMGSLGSTHLISGSIVLRGNESINGMLYVSSSSRLENQVVIGTGNPHTDNPEILHVQNSGSYNITHFQANHTEYAQVNITNTNSDGNASTDLVLTADNGTEFIHYVDLGINSSTYTGGLVGRENDSYLLNVGKDMYIGTVGGPSHPSDLHLFSQNSWEIPQIHISGSGQIGFNTLNITEGFQYEISGSAHFLNNVNVVQNVTTNGFTILSEVSSSLNFANDSEAQAGNVPLGGLYRSGSHILIRLT